MKKSCNVRFNLCILVLFCLTGCMTMGNKQITNDNAVFRIKAGLSKAEVKQQIGEPTGVILPGNGEEIWTYTYVDLRMKPATFVPIVGLFAGGANMDTRSLSIRFDTRGKVKAIGSMKISGGDHEREKNK